MGTSKIPAGGMTSCEEHFQIFGGDWYDFYTKEYPSLAEVKKEMDRVPPVPEWMKEVIADASGDYKAIKRLAETTDSGYIMVLLCTWGSWADYYVNEGLVGYQGGFITGQELKEHIQSLQAISPRVKVGIYTWMASASYESRIFAKHPEWFRQKDKQGNPVYLFPGVAPNYSSMINRKDCYDELLRQYDLIFDYLNLDFIYIDEGRNHNAINWATGDVSRDDHFYEFYLDVNKTAKKYGPEKVFFLNGRGNLYADVNYIEARGQLRAGYWRNFAGMGLGMEAMLKNLRPEARIIPLFWTPPLARDYVNRTIALGWIPATQYVDEVAQRPFITAAYEIGNLNTVKIDYSPDWKKDTATNLESYPMRRATGEYLLSFINNEEKTKTFDIKINLNTLKLDKNRNITVWGYRVANALEFKGQTSEKVSREIYRKTGWKMDLVAEPELLYLGKYTNDITLKIPLNPLELTVLEITDKSAGLYSVEGLPCNFYLAGQKGIKLTETASGVMIDSDIEEAEILLFVPKGKEAKNIKVDKRSADYELVDIAGNLLPVLKVNKGAGQMLEVALADAEGNVPAGKVRKEQGEKPAVKEEDLGLTPKKVDRIPEAKEITPVNRTVKGVKVLNKAVHMGSTTLGEYQLKLKPFTATVDIDNLVLEAGTTRKITENQGPAFAGIEMEGVKRIELRLANTYTGSFHLRGPRMHTHQYAKSHNEFAGFIVDYHTAGGYTKRVALGVGVMDPELNTNNPGYGKHSKPDALFNLGDIINESREKILTIDLTGYAPEGWDGKAWFSVGSDAVAADRRLTAEILNVNDKAKAASLTGTDPGAVRELFLKPKSMTVPKASPSPVIDGVVDEEIWQSAVVIDQFFLVGGENWPKAKTRAVLLYDNDYLYAGFTCEENSRKVPITGKGNIWDGDEVEILIDVNDDAGKTFHQIIVNAIGEKLELTEGGAFNGGTKVMATREEGRSWTVEIAIPFKGLGLEAPKSGDKWRFNLARYRPAGKDFENELIVWSSMEGWFLEFEKMGELIFK
ncbi:MAG: hypothetical protein JW957_04465, partial [Candidatus Omnitrophica bacterium]|nr:hypothetical protein [Candidatus Omnitrophota bacterium]